MKHLIDYTLYLADNALVLTQRNSEWCGHGPILEQDIAITNISLDLLGQARNFYQHAAGLINKTAADEYPVADHLRRPVTEDSLAYHRTEREFKNCLLVELPRGDWARTILRQFLFSNYQFLLFQRLSHHGDEQIAAITAKLLKEVSYHLRWSSEWVIRLGDGTAESRSRMEKAVEELWPYTGELFSPAPYEMATGLDPSTIQDDWQRKTAAVFEEATIGVPGKVFQLSGGKEGKHTEELGYLLAEMQYIQRTYPNSEW